MAKSRKDSKGRKLRDGESERKDGRYSFRYTDIRTGKRNSLYANTLQGLRKKEKDLEKDLDDDILTDGAAKKMTLNTLFEGYMSTRELADSTRTNYMRTWKNRVKDELGDIKVVHLRPSVIKAFYARLSKAGYSHSTIKLIHNLIFPALEMAVDDDIIRKNPSKGTLGDYGRPAEKREALTPSQQKDLLRFVQSHKVYKVYYPMLIIMFGTGVRCGELIGLTWDDVDMKKRTISIDHQLTYKNTGNGCAFHISSPKTVSGIRELPMTREVCRAFKAQRELDFLQGKSRDVDVEGYTGFIFTAKTGRPLMPNAVNSILYNIVDAYNKAELQRAKGQHRKAELLPRFSAHVTRHTACTRMAESGMDIKVLQYIMGHSDIEMTMQVYNHITDMSRVEKEVEKLDRMTANL